MGRALFSLTINNTAAAPPVTIRAAPAPEPPRWDSQTGIDPDSDEFFEGAIYEAFVDNPASFPYTSFSTIPVSPDSPQPPSRSPSPGSPPPLIPAAQALFLRRAAVRNAQVQAEASIQAVPEQHDPWAELRGLYGDPSSPASIASARSSDSPSGSASSPVFPGNWAIDPNRAELVAHQSTDILGTASDDDSASITIPSIYSSFPSTSDRTPTSSRSALPSGAIASSQAYEAGMRAGALARTIANNNNGALDPSVAQALTMRARIQLLELEGTLDGIMQDLSSYEGAQPPSTNNIQLPRAFMPSNPTQTLPGPSTSDIRPLRLSGPSIGPRTPGTRLRSASTSALSRPDAYTPATRDRDPWFTVTPRVRPAVIHRSTPMLLQASSAGSTNSVPRISTNSSRASSLDSTPDSSAPVTPEPQFVTPSMFTSSSSAYPSTTSSSSAASSYAPALRVVTSQHQSVTDTPRPRVLLGGDSPPPLVSPRDENDPRTMRRTSRDRNRESENDVLAAARYTYWGRNWPTRSSGRV